MTVVGRLGRFADMSGDSYLSGRGFDSPAR
jgi:hypothetical protein